MKSLLYEFWFCYLSNITLHCSYSIIKRNIFNFLKVEVYNYCFMIYYMVLLIEMYNCKEIFKNSENIFRVTTEVY